MSRMIEEFKEFVKTRPEMKKLVDSKKKTWQNLFEEWTLLGSNATWDNYKGEGDVNMKTSSTSKTTIPVSKEMAQLGDMLKACVGYVKKINPDSIAKTVNNVQKLMALVAGIGVANTAKASKSNKLTGDPLFDKKFDDWY